MIRFKNHEDPDYNPLSVVSLSKEFYDEFMDAYSGRIEHISRLFNDSAQQNTTSHEESSPSSKSLTDATSTPTVTPKPILDDTEDSTQKPGSNKKTSWIFLLIYTHRL